MLQSESTSVELKSRLFRLRVLVVERLVNCANATIENGFHGIARRGVVHSGRVHWEGAQQ